MSTANPLILDLLDFIDQSPTSWHAVDCMAKKLIAHNFIELKESERWSTSRGQSYFVTRNRSSLCAFTIPHAKPERVKLLASHTDSPGLKLKPNPEIKKFGSILLGTEIYGSPLISSWLNRDLGIAGRIIFTDKKGTLYEELVCLTEHPLIIPQLAIHLDREVNEKGLIINKQEHLNALAALGNDFSDTQSYLTKLLKEHINFEKLIDFDLFLFPLEKARLIGFKQKLIASYRLDSLSSVHAILQALLTNTPLERDIQMAIFWDDEEIGSMTAQGAQSPFFNQTLERLLLSLGLEREEYFCMLSNSTCISVDLAHALNPNFADKHDPNHQPLVGGGIVIKQNANQRYATTARSSIPIQIVSELEHIPIQRFVSRNDTSCGTTIGPLHACASGIPTVDIGCSQLSMHSSREIMSCQDHVWMCHLLQKILSTPHPFTFHKLG